MSKKLLPLDNLDQVGKRLKSSRQGTKKTQKEIASLLGTTQAAINRWETGRSEPPLGALVKLAKIYDKSVDYFLGVLGKRGASWLQAISHLLPTLDALDEQDSVALADAIEATLKLKGLEPPGKSNPHSRPIGAQKRQGGRGGTLNFGIMS